MISEGSDDVSKAPLFGFDANSMTLYLKQIPVHIKRQDLLAVVNTTPGFVSFSMSEPLKTQNFTRYGWVCYDSDENCRKGKEILEKTTIGDFTLQPVKSQTQRKPIRITPPLPDDNIERDLELCQNLVADVLDPEKKIDFAVDALLAACK